MAICVDCQQEMTSASTCTVATLHVAGSEFPTVRYGAESRYPRYPRPNRPCHDCGVSPGGQHHLGCDWAECPRCRGQLLSCGCRFDEVADNAFGE
jgi:hypothetical protein